MTLLLAYLAIAIGVSFLCSVLEAVLLSITPSYLEQLTQERPKSGEAIQSVKDRLDESLSSILILNTFAHTMGAAGVGAQALRVFGPEAETLIAVLLTLAILYFSEIIPKTLGASYWRQLAVPAAFTIRWLVLLVYPLVWVSTRLTQVLGKSHKDEITREEILALASLGRKDGAKGARERVPGESASKRYPDQRDSHAAHGGAHAGRDHYCRGSAWLRGHTPIHAHPDVSRFHRQRHWYGNACGLFEAERGWCGDAIANTRSRSPCT